MRELYPDITPFQSEWLTAENLNPGPTHQIYLEQCGNPEGIPVLFLHGGPGSGCGEHHRRYFDPEHYHIVLFDQRGCGRSEPLGELQNNTTQDLVRDMEAIRQHLGIKQWLLFGGSWGATLALCYARDYPQQVQAMILRGTFLGRRQDIEWVYAEGGASRIFHDSWQRLTHDLPAEAQKKPLPYYMQQLTEGDEATRLQAAKTLQHWEGTIVKMRDAEYQPDPDAMPGPLAHSRIQLHFALNDCFIADRPLLDELEKLRHIPADIIHGRYDMVCPFEQSWALHQAWPESRLEVVPLAGHAAGEPGIVDALVRATDNMHEQLS